MKALGSLIAVTLAHTQTHTHTPIHWCASLWSVQW